MVLHQIHIQLTLVWPLDNTTSKLSEMSIVEAMNPLVFNSDVYEYVYPRALNETWYVAYTVLTQKII